MAHARYTWQCMLFETNSLWCFAVLYAATICPGIREYAREAVTMGDGCRGLCCTRIASNTPYDGMQGTSYMYEFGGQPKAPL